MALPGGLTCAAGNWGAGVDRPPGFRWEKGLQLRRRWRLEAETWVIGEGGLSSWVLEGGRRRPGDLESWALQGKGLGQGLLLGSQRDISIPGTSVGVGGVALISGIAERGPERSGFLVLTGEEDWWPGFSEKRSWGG